MGRLSPLYDVRYVPDMPLDKILVGWSIERQPEYVEEWNKDYDDYFNRLEKSILEHGLKVPFIINKGGCDIVRLLHLVASHHDNEDLPDFPIKTMTDAFVRGEEIRDWYFMTERGGARFYVLKKLGIKTAPCIILDFDGTHKNDELIASEGQFREKFHMDFRSKLEFINFGKYDITYFIGQDDEFNF